MIQTKQKPCKGTGKAIGYGCGKPNYKRTYGLGHECKCYANWLFNTPEGKESKDKLLIKAKNDVEKDVKTKKKAKKIEFTNWKPKLQDKINEIIRLIDLGQPCLARNYHPKQTHAGHIFSRGSTPTLKYNLHNIHRQSAQSNHYQNEDGLLREGLMNEYGNSYFEFLQSARSHPALKFSNEEYHQFFLIASQIALRLRKEGFIFSRDERIEKRNELNIELGIYSEFKSFSI